MKNFNVIVITIAMLAAGCSIGNSNSNDTGSSVELSRATSNQGNHRIDFSNLPLVDRSDALYEANEASELREVIAFLSATVGLNVDGQFHPLVDKSTIIPCEKTITIAPAENRQDAIELELYYGERLELNQNKCIGKFIVLLDSYNSQMRSPVLITIVIGRREAGKILGDVQVSASQKESGRPLALRRI